MIRQMGSGQATTVNGSIEVSFLESPKTDSHFETVNGRIVLRFPDQLSADFELSSWQGDMFSEFPVAPIPQAPPSVRREDGRKVGDLATSVEIAASATDLDPVKLRTAADSDAVRERVAASTQRFFDHQLDQRPSFIIESEIGDKAIFSGLWKSDPLMSILDSILDDHARQTAHAKQFGGPPTV